jgi:hypothetical protein|nr:MAG TPA: hypothetical protein [Caudoviricetes sp.]
MKEEDLTKAIELKKKLDSERELLQFANSHYDVDLRVNLEERCDHGRVLNIDYLLDKDVIKGLRAMVIAKMEKRVNDLQEELEKL